MRRINAIYLSAILILVSAQTSHAVEVEGTFTGVVTFASDPGQASFGRDPALWLGEEVTGTFSYDIETPEIVNVLSAPGEWNYLDPRPLPTTRWVRVTATIDGTEFTTEAMDNNPQGRVGGNVQIRDNTMFGSGDWFSVQDGSGCCDDISNLPGPNGIVIGVIGPPDLLSYSDGDGAISFDFAPGPGIFADGAIFDFLPLQGRTGEIRFVLTSLTFGKSLEDLVAGILESVTGVGPGRSLSDKMAAVQAYIEAEDLEAACELLNAFENQVSAQSGKKLAEAEADQILGSAEEIREQLSCISR